MAAEDRDQRVDDTSGASDSDSVSIAGSGAAAGAVAGATVGSIAGPLGIAAGAIGGAVIGGIAGGVAGQGSDSPQLRADKELPATRDVEAAQGDVDPASRG